ncbi:cytidylyltransferase domain-containing protein [Neobacillus sp. NRS-1170]|uniref:cytidylyltransferase domain-containing protein n=1 Tax=Neobacillus sp. NRS-1170 TaxID=3233898 RepID=UPI003D2A5EDE
MIGLTTAAIIQARMGSTRLPGKVMKKILGKTILEHVVTRVKQSNQIDEIVIATTNKAEDDPIAIEADRLQVNYYRGSEHDVLSRYYFSAKENDADIIVRITSDCPLIDPVITDQIIGFYKTKNYDIVSNAGAEPSQRTYPRGLDTEVFSFEQLENAFNNATERYQKEHVTPFIYENSDKVYFYKNYIDYSKFRWTLDTIEDFELITKVYEYLYHGEHNFYLDDIIRLFEVHPDLMKINAEIEQKKIK